MPPPGPPEGGGRVFISPRVGLGCPGGKYCIARTGGGWFVLNLGRALVLFLGKRSSPRPLCPDVSGAFAPGAIPAPAPAPGAPAKMPLFANGDSTTGVSPLRISGGVGPLESPDDEFSKIVSSLSSEMFRRGGSGRDQEVVGAG